MYILNLAQTTLPMFLCTTGREELLYSLVASKDYNIISTNITHTLIQAWQAFMKDRERSVHLSIRLLKSVKCNRLIKGCFGPFQALLCSCQAGSLSRHPQTKRVRGSPGLGTKGGCTQERRCPGMHGASGALAFSTTQREQGKEAPRCFVIRGIRVFSCTRLSF